MHKNWGHNKDKINKEGAVKLDNLKKTVLYNAHLAANATMVDFGGWDMPVQYPEGIIAEHLFTRRYASMFDVSHMGRLLIEGPERLAFLQYALTSNAAELTLNRAQYCILSDEEGSAIDDAYLYIFDEDSFLLVVNASNLEKDFAHLQNLIKGFDCTLTDISPKTASIALQGPDSDKILAQLTGGFVPEGKRNTLATTTLDGRKAWIGKTGYTGEIYGYEFFISADDAVALWDKMLELGVKPAGLGARDTLRLEAGLPLYGHEFGVDADGQKMPIYAVPLAKFAVSFDEAKGDFVGKAALAKQAEAVAAFKDKDFSKLELLPKKIQAITLTDRGVIRAGMPVYFEGAQVGWTTSGTVVPYYNITDDGEKTILGEETEKRSIGLCYIESQIPVGATVEVDVRGRRLAAAIVSRHMKANMAPYVRPVIYGK